MTRLLFYITYLNRLKNEEVTFSIRGQDHTEDEPGTAGPPLKRLPLLLQLDPASPFLVFPICLKRSCQAQSPLLWPASCSINFGLNQGRPLLGVLV